MDLVVWYMFGKPDPLMQESNTFLHQCTIHLRVIPYIYIILHCQCPPTISKTGQENLSTRILSGCTSNVYVVVHLCALIINTNIS